MGNRKGAIFTAVLIVGLAAGTGCVGKGMFRTNVDDTDKRVGAVEDAVEANGRRLDDLGKSTDQKIAGLDAKTAQAVQLGNQAMTKAEAAAQAALGKLLWETTITDDGVKFDFGKTQLSAGAISKLDSLIAQVRSYGKALYIEVEGHADAVGDDALNDKLATRRATVVRDYLNQKGIPLHAINTISYGESRPVADNSSPAGRAQNRRVVIRVLE